MLEAATIDGAGPARRFWTIVFPLLLPTTFFLIVVNIGYAFFDTFGIIDSMTGSGPAKATETLVYKVYFDGRLGGAISDPDDHRHRPHRDPVPLSRAQGDVLMVEQHRFGNLLPHLLLWIDIAIIAFPVYLAFVGSTHEPTIISNSQMPPWPGSHMIENYCRTIFIGTAGTTREPVGTMLINSFIMAMVIACGRLPSRSSPPSPSSTSDSRCE